MNKKKPITAGMKIIIVLSLTFVWVTVAAADAIPPHIYMNTGMEPYEPGVIKARVLDDNKVNSVTLFYRQHGESYYNSIDMKHRNDIYYRELNKELGLDGTVEYYILAQDTSGNEITEPRMDPEENPMTAAASTDADISAPEVTLSNPEPGAVLDTGDEMIMITFYNVGREIDFNTVRLKVDKRDRTRAADFISEKIP